MEKVEDQMKNPKNLQKRASLSRFFQFKTPSNDSNINGENSNSMSKVRKTNTLMRFLNKKEEKEEKLPIFNSVRGWLSRKISQINLHHKEENSEVKLNDGSSKLNGDQVQGVPIADKQ